ncbi:MAG: ribonuclease D [Steroidobacteraceae bacterium]|nr:ribonuclease D [Nevskiaceae bacterium]MCP5338819.1 ribonuclease D [Nevskiaceae bacterium]MCP5360883.1 ribonuclease D [Nevskiaceae bacterium]MCP5466266.1 ribonuclease D [Nevskiaceae bacterium]MCP5471668.1 ribonuclease D [Nevskiaceae bacterium]
MPIIATPEALADVAARVQTTAAIGLDTEFLRERTYRAELCLVQLTTPTGPVCVDPLALAAELGPPLTSMLAAGSSTGATPLKVLHAARQDLEVLFPVVGPIGPVFDTQVAAALAGHPAQVGYAELVRRILGHDLPKAHTRTDWSRRPLSPEQIEYALDDVRFLLPLRDALQERLEQLGRSAWLEEELGALTQLAGVQPDPERAWLRLKGLQGLDPGRIALAQALTAWRERRAIAKNRPRGWILDDTALREIVNRVPRSHAALATIPEMQDGIVRHSGDELLAMVETAAIPDPAPPLPRRERPDPAFTALLRRLAEVVQQVAGELDIAAELLATRRDLEQLARGEPVAALRRGWRREIIGERLRALV